MNRVSTLVLGFLSFLFFFQNSEATPHYVAPVAAGSANGSSWANASDNLQAMIDISTAGDQVYVAAGTYKPTAYPTGCIGCTSTRDKAFLLKAGVSVYGGFFGSPTNPSILSGDFLGNDVVSGSGSTLAISNNSENAYHVVLSTGATNSTILDGFTIQGGNADGSGSSIQIGSVSFSEDIGGGIYNLESSPTISNCIFTGNYAISGAGMANYDSSPLITTCTYNKNKSNAGGGMYNSSNINSPISILTINNSIFSENYAGQGGGVENTSYSSLAINNCTFTSNAAGYGGGGISNQSDSTTTIDNSTFYSNSAGYEGGGVANSEIVSITNSSFTYNHANYEGGGLMNQSHSSATITNCTFVSNSSNYSGGGSCNQTNSNTNYNRCTFHNNTSHLGAGIIAEFVDHFEITNSAFTGNVANPSGGGGMTIISSLSNATVRNCTFFNNSSGGGGGIYNLNSSSTLENNIIWGNFGGSNPNIFFQGATSPTVSYSTIQGTSIYPGTGNNNVNPIFVNSSDPDGLDNIWRTADDGLSLQNTTMTPNPMISASNPATTFPLMDITGYARTVPFDRGAYEYQNKAALPIQLLSFSGKNQETENILEWKTSSESNSSHFDIERSKDGLAFNKLDSLGAAGNSSSTSIYQFIDEHPLSGINFYKLKMVDVDEQYKFSNIIQITNNTENQISIYPNPVEKELRIKGNKKNYSYEIWSTMGQKIQTGKISPDQPLLLNNLSRGHYWIKLDGLGLQFFKK